MYNVVYCLCVIIFSNAFFFCSLDFFLSNGINRLKGRVKYKRPQSICVKCVIVRILALYFSLFNLSRECSIDACPAVSFLEAVCSYLMSQRADVRGMKLTVIALRWEQETFVAQLIPTLVWYQELTIERFLYVLRIYYVKVCFAL